LTTDSLTIRGRERFSKTENLGGGEGGKEAVADELARRKKLTVNTREKRKTVDDGWEWSKENSSHRDLLKKGPWMDIIKRGKSYTINTRREKRTGD